MQIFARVAQLSSFTQAAQVLGGYLRGSKGGPTDHRLRGDHYDMTARRVWFGSSWRKWRWRRRFRH